MDKKSLLNKMKYLTSDFIEGKDFEKSILNIIDYINHCSNEKEKYKKQLEEYNKDKEISKRDEKIKDLKEHSLLIMTDAELIAEKAFRAEHYKKCKNSNCYQYELTGNEIGTCIKIICPKCGKSKDITDVGAW